MSTRTTNDIVNDIDEPKWTCKCNQFLNLDEPELPITTLLQGLRTWWSDPAYERDYGLCLIYLLGGVFCLLVVIIVLAEIYWDIEWLLSRGLDVVLGDWLAEQKAKAVNCEGKGLHGRCRYLRMVKRREWAVVKVSNCLSSSNDDLLLQRQVLVAYFAGSKLLSRTHT